ncbi:MAG: Ca2+-dependent phosphoinositide-specific phospholipase C, partial [Acidimicrobiales bacterium]
MVLAVLAAACGGGDDPAPSTGSRSSTTTASTVPAEDDLKLNQIQAIGTHNSFHVAADPAEQDLLAALSPADVVERDYTHAPLTEQLEDQKVRVLELDVYVDTAGGRYDDPVFRRQAGLGPYDEPAMSEPGIKVFHEQDIDYHSRCVTLELCLTEIRTWSDEHPEHVPLAINIQFRDGPIVFAVPDQAIPEKWDTAQLDALDAEITDVFPRERIITPDDVRGGLPTLAAAVEAGQWPTLGESRGKVIFLMINPEPYRTLYLQGHDGLRGRVLFTNAAPGQPDAAYFGID